VITYVNPAVAVALGVSVLGERFTPAMAVSFALILGGSVLATRAGGPRSPRPERAAGEDPACLPESGATPAPGRP
jgi:drug/metabolite transporter (DMT)-like permease